MCPCLHVCVLVHVYIMLAYIYVHICICYFNHCKHTYFYIFPLTASFCSFILCLNMCYILYIVLRASWKISLLAKCCHPHKIKSLLTYLLSHETRVVTSLFNVFNFMPSILYQFPPLELPYCSGNLACNICSLTAA